MDLGLENKVTLVVDSQLAIATAAAVAMAKEGALLALSAPGNHFLRHVEIELARQNIPQENFRGVIADLDKEQDIRRLVRETLHRQGEVEVLVTTVQDHIAEPTSKLHDEQIEPALSRNFRAAVRLTREVVPHMKRLGQGRIINLLPLAALEVTPRTALSSLSMAPILAYFKGLASELAPQNITVNNIIYAGVSCKETEDCLRAQAARELGGADDATEVQARTDVILREIAGDVPMRRMAEPREIGDIVCMIASSQASYMTGANIMVDGGVHHSYA